MKLDETSIFTLVFILLNIFKTGIYACHINN